MALTMQALNQPEPDWETAVRYLGDESKFRPEQRNWAREMLAQIQWARDDGLIREQLRDIINGKACVFPASVHDPISARIAEELGIEMGMFAGSVASLAVLGAPDAILLTLSEFATLCYYKAATDCPCFGRLCSC